MGLEGGEGTRDALDRGRDQRHAQAQARGMHGIARGEAVAAVGHEIIACDQRLGIGGIQPDVVGLDGDARVEIGDASARAVGLAPAERCGPVQDLSMEVGKLDPVVIDHAEPPDACTGEIEQEGDPKPPAPTTRTRAWATAVWPRPPISGRTSWRA